MKFPGRRKYTHYFPVEKRQLELSHQLLKQRQRAAPVCGIDQTLVDIEALVDQGFIERHSLVKGSSLLINDQAAEALLSELEQRKLISSVFAGGTIANTLHNYATLADSPAVLFGVMSKHTEIGGLAYRYLCDTSSRVDLNQLQAVDGPIGRCFTLISEDGERSFAISKGDMDKLRPESLNQQQVAQASALLLSSYLMRAGGDPISEAAEQAIGYAQAAEVPVVLTTGTRFVIEDNPQWWQQFIADKVNVLAMNEEEAEALTGISDPLQACEQALQWCDIVLCTAGAQGLYLAGHCDRQYLRQTKREVLDASISAFNEYEFSRPMRQQDCQEPVAIYSHIAPYLGGPEQIKNTNGAGDAALAAVLHDLSANAFHKQQLPESSKHHYSALCYSSLSQICKYANRASYEVLVQHSPRLSRGLPEREEGLEESYWAL